MKMPAKLKTILDHEHIAYLAVSHKPAYCAQYAASVMHIPGKEVAKTVVLRAGKNLLLAVLPASCRINMEKMRALVGSRVHLVAEDECSRLFPDCEHGVFPAFGELYGLPVYLDKLLAQDRVISLSAGTRTDAIRMSTFDFVNLVKPKIRSFAESSKNWKAVPKDWATTLNNARGAEIN
jgi:Ala-tRNA(Pro) deacylase